MTMRTAALVFSILLAACGDDETAPPPATSVASTAASSGGATGAGGAGGGGGEGAGTLGRCPPDEPATGEGCDSVDLVCAFATSCCICQNLQCDVVWACIDPAQNGASCPAGAPNENQPCQDEGLACGYCIGGVPERWECAAGAWAPSAIATCP